MLLLLQPLAEWPGGGRESHGKKSEQKCKHRPSHRGTFYHCLRLWLFPAYWNDCPVLFRRDLLWKLNIWSAAEGLAWCLWWQWKYETRVKSLYQIWQKFLLGKNNCILDCHCYSLRNQCFSHGGSSASFFAQPLRGVAGKSWRSVLTSMGQFSLMNRGDRRGQSRTMGCICCSHSPPWCLASPLALLRVIGGVISV